MTDFKKANNLNDIDFPFHDYDAILDQFVDDLAVYTPRNNLDNYKGKYSPMQMHLLAIESIIYALSRFGWLISLRKSTIAKKNCFPWSYMGH